MLCYAYHIGVCPSARLRKGGGGGGLESQPFLDSIDLKIKQNRQILKIKYY